MNCSCTLAQPQSPWPLSLCTLVKNLGTHQLHLYHISNFKMKTVTIYGPKAALLPAVVFFNKGYNKTNVQTHWLSHWFPVTWVHV